MSAMTITPDTLREIEEKAKAATEGPWPIDGFNLAAVIHDTGNRVFEKIAECGGHGSTDNWKANAAHIASMDPPTTLALVARIRELEEALKWVSERADSGGRRLETAADACDEIARRAATAYKGG